MRLIKTPGAGRPMTITDSAITKLELAFSYGCTLRESLELAGISRDAYYRLLERQPEFRHRFEMLQQRMILKARANVAEAIYAGDVATSKWLLEKKDPEFQRRGATGPALKVEGADDAAVTLELRALIDRVAGGA